MSNGSWPGLHLGLALVALVAAAAIGWIAALSIQSPAEVAARTAPPNPSLITVPIESTELSSDVVVRGDIRYDAPTQLSLSGSLGPDIESSVVTAIAEEEDDINDGSVIMEVAGRPVFVLQGSIPMYRALRPGSQGPDVTQLEQALVRLGYLNADPDDLWDANTTDAVTAWYEAAGYSPNPPVNSDAAALDAAHERLSSADAALRDAQASLAAAGAPNPESAEIAARSAVETAREQLASTERDGATANAAAAANLASARDDATTADEAFATAADRLTQAEQGTHPDTGEPPTDTELDELRDAVTAATHAVEAAQQAIGSAEVDVVGVSTTQASLIRQARDALAIAEAQLSELLAPPDTGTQKRQVTAAAQERDAATEALALLSNKAGPWIPAGELIYVSELPARVDAVTLAVGDPVVPGFVTLSASTLSIHTAIPVRDTSLVTPGAPVMIHHDSLEIPLEGTVVHIAERPGTNGVAGDATYAEIAVDGIPAALTGLNVRIVIPIESSDGAVLAVPAAALSVTTSGQTRIELLDGTMTRIVNVEVGLAADGLVEITPSGDELLEPGMQVVIGRDRGT
ncbi:MAG: hypothetical protein GXP35_12725 [Actinobacteria bacterium]|nr:hypothetical protein [Actinomycetota bacterium]